MGCRVWTSARCSGMFEFDLAGHVAYAYSLAVLFVLFLVARRLVASPFGWSVRAVKGNRLRSAAIGVPVNARLIAIYTIAAAYAGRRRRAAGANHPIRLARRTDLPAVRRRAADAGDRRQRNAVRRIGRSGRVPPCAGLALRADAAILGVLGRATAGDRRDRGAQPAASVAPGAVAAMTDQRSR